MHAKKWSSPGVYEGSKRYESKEVIIREIMRLNECLKNSGQESEANDIAHPDDIDVDKPNFPSRARRMTLRPRM